MARESLLCRIAVGSVHRMRGELPPAEAAESYEEELREFFGEPDEPASFDLILLGLGEDGHTASLFPETSALEVTDRWVVANPVLKLETTRLTLTIPVINAAKVVTFLVAGEGKAEALREILEGDADPHAYPAKFIRPESGDLGWMLDQAAAEWLSKTS
jgi:6-phosphogluconolactonase